MSEIAYAPQQRNPDHFPSVKPFQGLGELVAEDIMPGDIVKFMHEHDHTNGAQYYEELALVLDRRDHLLDVVHIDPYSEWKHGSPRSAHLTDRGLTPYVNPDGMTYWNTVNHTQSTGHRIPPHFHSREEAIGIKKALDGMSELQERYGITPIEPTIESLAMDALLKFAIEGKKDPLFFQGEAYDE
jgi:hypothetical protein